ncbi:hypothetical protein BpHYR1_005432 [Brachionus plicatilis]|uniref:Uncharacterized protein n=1 Tax=Brachionus plicatilis TaxID=10195 RepID=A0A3M7Q2G9_BRAPC|nr:hypothetical protein BpHYR1_005432 [Brachionus plicatilis]
MIKKSEITKNELEFLIGKHLETKLIAFISISSIVDFPILRPKQMMRKLCSYVANVKYYLSYLKIRTPGIISKGRHLNEIPIDKQNQQLPNKPKNIKGKKRRKESSSDSEYTTLFRFR